MTVVLTFLQLLFFLKAFLHLLQLQAQSLFFFEFLHLNILVNILITLSELTFSHLLFLEQQIGSKMKLEDFLLDRSSPRYVDPLRSRELVIRMFFV